MWDLIVDAIHTIIRNGLTWSSLLAVIFLFLKNRKLKKLIGSHLPKPFRDTSDQDIQEIKQDVKAIINHLGVEGGWNASISKRSKEGFRQELSKRSTLLPETKSTARFTGKSMIGRMKRMKKFVRKMASRKFWALVVSLITSNMILFGASEDMIVKVAAVITQFGSVVIYMLVEGGIDKEAQKQNVFVVNGKEEQYEEHHITEEPWV